jgi:hypothetical protein
MKSGLCATLTRQGVSSVCPTIVRSVAPRKPAGLTATSSSFFLPVGLRGAGSAAPFEEVGAIHSVSNGLFGSDPKYSSGSS